jgi:hypothetical protein
MSFSCPMCGYVCTLPYGHTQPDHDTSHGSMSKTQWALDGDESSVVEIDGHKFAANDAGAPMLCNTVCEAQGRHVHLDDCRASDGAQCMGNEIEHLTAKISPNPDKPKDAISHSVFWKRSGVSISLLACGALSPPLGFKGSRPLVVARFVIQADWHIADPYSRENQAEFAKCDHLCCGRV